MPAASLGTPSKLMRLRIQASRYYTYYKEAGPAWAVMFASSRIVPVRTVVEKLQKMPSLEAYRGKPTNFPNVDPEAFTANLERDGAATGLDIRPEVARAIADFGKAAPAYTNPVDPGRALIYLTDTLDIHTHLPVLHELEQDPVLLEIAARYLKHEPVHMGTRLWWATAKPSRLEERTKFGQELFHYDLHDYRSVKFNVYLTDVGEEGGGTAYVAGSQNRKRPMQQATFFIGRSDQEMIDTYGKDALRVVTGKAGSGFAFDPYTYHRGTRPASDRLMLQIEFGRRRYLKNCYADAAPLKV